jgi:hypothetical protein
VTEAARGPKNPGAFSGHFGVGHPAQTEKFSRTDRSRVFLFLRFLRRG